jgi:hypothetical protein
MYIPTYVYIFNKILPQSLTELKPRNAFENPIWLLLLSCQKSFYLKNFHYVGVIASLKSLFDKKIFFWQLVFSGFNYAKELL